MSYQILTQDVLFYQRFLKANGFYTDILDGEWGKNTDAADAAFVAASDAIIKKFGTFDKRSEGNIITLIPKAQILARQFLKLLTGKGFDVRIISGTRTYAEQNALYAQGRNGDTRLKVSNAKGGQSNHNFGLAWDIGIFEDGVYITDDKKYKALAAEVKDNFTELEWGGDWKTFKDFPHYQFKAVSESVTVVRNLFEKGTIYV